MDNYFVINSRLPSLNDVINANRTNRFMGAKMKKEIEEMIGWQIRFGVARGHLRSVSRRCVIQIDFYEKTKRRDVDNIQSSTKFILDAMVKHGILLNDSRKYVKQIYHEIYDSDRDYVVVRIFEDKKASN